MLVKNVILRLHKKKIKFFKVDFLVHPIMYKLIEIRDVTHQWSVIEKKGTHIEKKGPDHNKVFLVLSIKDKKNSQEFVYVWNLISL